MSKGVNDGERKWKREFSVAVALGGPIIIAIIAVVIAVGPPPHPQPRTFLDAAFMVSIVGSIGILHVELSERIKIREVEGFSRLILNFFIVGLSLTSSGLLTTSLAIVVNAMDVAGKFRDVTNFYVQISLNFLLGGITLVGASLPVLQSLFRQETSQPPQCNGDSSGGQQSK